MKIELLATAEEPNNSQFSNREKMEKLLGLCLTRDKLLQLERNIGADFDLLKQTLVGCFVRVPVQGRPMLAAIRSVKDSCQIEWARFGRRLRLTDSLGYFEFDQVDPKISSRKEMKRWCQRREQKGRAPLSDEFIEEKLAQLNKFSMEAETAEAEQPQSAEEDVNNIWTDEAGTSSGRDEEKENIGNGSTDDENDGFETDPMIAGSDQSDEEENTSMKAEELPELPNVEGLVRSRELLTQVLLPCRDFLKFFFVRVKNQNKVLSRFTAGCMMAFRIVGKRQPNEVIVDEIVRVKSNIPYVHFKLGHVVNAANLLVVDESKEVTDRVFDQWLQRLAIKNEPVPDLLDKYTRKMHALSELMSKGMEWNKHIIRSSDSRNRLPDIARIVVTARELEWLVNKLKLDELNRVLTGCLVCVKSKKYMLELEKQPNMHGLFVVPIARVVFGPRMKKPRSRSNWHRTFLHFGNRRLPIRHRKMGKKVTEIGLKNVANQKFRGINKLLLQSLLAMAELNIPLPSDEEIARKRAQLDDAMAKAASSSSHSKSITSKKRKQLQQPPASSATTTAVLPNSRPNQPVPIKQQRQKKRRRIGTSENEDAGKKPLDGKRQRLESDL